MEEARKNEINNKMYEYAVFYWKYSPDDPGEPFEELTGTAHINHTIELLEEDVFNEAREEEAEELIRALKALRVDGSIGKRLAEWANWSWKGYFSDDELNEFAYDYNTDGDTLAIMVERMEEEEEEHEDDEEFKTLLNDCRAHLETLAH